MSNEKAFPNPHLRDDSGITMRDYFAARAMQSILVGIECAPDDVKNVVESAYVLADAMLKEREQ